MTEGGDTKDDLQLPSGTDDAEALARQIKADFDSGKELQVSVMKVRRARTHSSLLRQLRRRRRRGRV